AARIVAAEGTGIQHDLGKCLRAAEIDLEILSIGHRRARRPATAVGAINGIAECPPACPAETPSGSTKYDQCRGIRCGCVGRIADGVSRPHSVKISCTARTT